MKTLNTTEVFTGQSQGHMLLWYRQTDLRSIDQAVVFRSRVLKSIRPPQPMKQELIVKKHKLNISGIQERHFPQFDNCKNVLSTHRAVFFMSLSLLHWPCWSLRRFWSAGSHRSTTNHLGRLQLLIAQSLLYSEWEHWDRRSCIGSRRECVYH